MNNKQSLTACLKNGLLVAQATRLFRPATRRTERERRFEPMGPTFRDAARGTSGRRVADRRGRVARATHFQDRLSAGSPFDPDDFNHGGSDKKRARIAASLPPFTVEFFLVRFGEQTQLNQHRQVVFEKRFRPFPQWRAGPRDAKEGFDFPRLKSVSRQ